MCGCGGKRSSSSRMPSGKKTIGPSVGPLSVQGGIAAGPGPANLRALNLQNAQSPKSAARLEAGRLEIMKKRREAIRNKLNK